jgi:hypothetical protein
VSYFYHSLLEALWEIYSLMLNRGRTWQRSLRRGTLKREGRDC